jgi:hypothetical protein
MKYLVRFGSYASAKVRSSGLYPQKRLVFDMATGG